MSQQQRAVLRRKKAYVADVVTRTDELVAEMRNAGLIDEETVKDLKDEKNPSSLVMRLIDSALTSPIPGAYDVFMNLLSKRHQWLVEELRMELMYEQGSQAVDLEVAKEASSLVHKKFGSSKRFGEGDKKDILDLLSVKIQLKNEEWQNRIQSTEDRVKQLQNSVNQRDNVAHDISRSIRGFIRDQNKRLLTHSHDMTTTSDILQSCLITDEDNDTLNDLKSVTDKLLFRMGQILQHREALLNERTKSLQALKIRDEQARVDKAIKDVVSTYNKQIRKLKHENEKLSNVDTSPNIAHNENATAAEDKDILDLLEEKDSAIWRLTSRVAELEKDNTSKHRQIVDLREELDNTRTEMISLRRNIRSLETSVESYRKKQAREGTVHFSGDQDSTVSIVELTTLPSITSKKKTAAKSGKRSASGAKLLRRPSTVH